MSQTAVPARLVLVDDDVEMLDALANLLQLKGFQVNAFHSAEAALDHLRSHPHCDLVISDLRLGESSNGFDLYRNAQEIRETPFLILSGDTSGFEDLQDIYKVKMLLKPVPTSVLLTEIKSILRR